MVDTIYALATPQGRAGVAVVRISGPDAFMSLNVLCNDIRIKPRKTMPFSIMSGTYNLAATKDVFSWENYIFECLKKCWSKTSKAMVFNLQIADRAEVSENNIYFAEKNKIIETCVALFGPTRVIFDKDLPNDATFSVINRNLVSS